MTFIVSGDRAIRDSLVELMSSAGLHAEAFPSLKAWLDAIDPERQGCLVLDARCCDFTSPSCVAKFTATCAQRPVLLLIDRGDVPVAVRAIKDGVADVLEKPFRNVDLLERIERIERIERATVAARGAT